MARMFYTFVQNAHPRAIVHNDDLSFLLSLDISPSWDLELDMTSNGKHTSYQGRSPGDSPGQRLWQQARGVNPDP
jgi:hypothetical protein